MEYTILIILLALLQYVFFTVRVGATRGKHEVEAPSTAGHETWERLYRVQLNTLEQLIIFIPTAFIFGMYIPGYWILIPGLLFLLGRTLYSIAYVKDPASRGLGMGVTLLANAILLGGGIVALLMKMF